VNVELGVNKYVFKPYMGQFPLLFDREKQRLATFLTCPACIEHIGSTAVAGLGGKGIVDIAIAVAPACLTQASADLQCAGYAFRPQAGSSERWFHRMDRPDPIEGTRRYHVHLTHPETGEWRAMLALRDYLRTHPDAAAAYAHAKQIAAEQAVGDGQRYMEAKSPVLEQILDAALHTRSAE
jgi:GrpB-like predicted nucleotidyltransferase (UPF0157 family)